MRHLFPFLCLTSIINSCTTSSLSKYIEIQKVDTEEGYCTKRYSKEGKFLNGSYKINHGKGLITYAIYKNGYYLEAKKESTGFIWSKEKYDEEHNLIEYVHLVNKKNKNLDEYYNIKKFDSVKTLFQRNNIIKSIFYVNNEMYNVDYELEKQKIKVKIENFKINNNMNVFSAIPSKFFFSDCYNNSFLYDKNQRYRVLYIEISEPNGVKNQIFTLDNQEKESNKINFYDYFDTTDY